MKTYLVWNVASPLSEDVCRAFALHGQRLLLCGPNPQQLAQLDEQLAQNELHRYNAPTSFSAAYEWVTAEHLGFDGCVAFAPEGSMHELGWARELLDAFAPLLKRSKKPKRVLLVIEADAHSMTATGDGPKPAAQAYSEAELRAGVSNLARLLTAKGVVLNALAAPPSAVAHLETAGETPTSRPLPDPNTVDLPGVAVSSTRAAQCCVTLLDGFSPSLTGQTLSFALDCTQP